MKNWCQFPHLELYTKYQRIVPQKFWEEELYQKPDDKVVKMVKKERASRKVFKKDLNEEKMKVQRCVKEEGKETRLMVRADIKSRIKETMENIAYDDLENHV